MSLRASGMPYELDRIDREIIAALRADGRMSVTVLAETVHVSRANAYARVERLRRDGVIRGFTVSVDADKEGLHTSAYVSLKVRPKELREFEAAIANVPEIVHAALVSGDVDAVLMVRTTQDAALGLLLVDRLLHLPGVESSRTMLIFQELATASTLG
jgi:DNA-binding Lrp family transcriptional regulator